MVAYVNSLIVGLMNSLFGITSSGGKATFSAPPNVASGGSTTIGAGVGSIKMSTGNSANNAVWIPISYAGTTYFVPGFTTNAP